MNEYPRGTSLNPIPIGPADPPTPAQLEFANSAAGRAFAEFAEVLGPACLEPSTGLCFVATAVQFAVMAQGWKLINAPVIEYTKPDLRAQVLNPDPHLYDVLHWFDDLIDSPTDHWGQR